MAFRGPLDRLGSGKGTLRERGAQAPGGFRGLVAERRTAHNPRSLAISLGDSKDTV